MEKRILRTTEQKLVALDQGEMMDNLLLQDNKQNYIGFKLGCHKHILQCYLLYLFMFLQNILEFIFSSEIKILFENSA